MEKKQVSETQDTYDKMGGVQPQTDVKITGRDIYDALKHFDGRLDVMNKREAQYKSQLDNQAKRLDTVYNYCGQRHTPQADPQAQQQPSNVMRAYPTDPMQYPRSRTEIHQQPMHPQIPVQQQPSRISQAFRQPQQPQQMEQHNNMMEDPVFATRFKYITYAIMGNAAITLLIYLNAIGVLTP